MGLADIYLSKKKAKQYKQLTKEKIYRRMIASQAAQANQQILTGQSALQPAQASQNLPSGQSQPKSVPRYPPQAAVVDLHRHAMAHAFEENVKNYCNSVPSKNIKSLAARPYDWKDVVVLLNHKFPTYLDSVATVLDSENK
jgi:hypothetical protein